MNKKILLFDIETRPLLSYTWGIWEQNVIDVKEEWNMLSFSWKWLGEKKTHVLTLPDFPHSYKKNKDDDKALCFELWKLFNKADVIIGHNGDGFDIKKTNARFLKHGFSPPSPYKTIDTLKVAKRYFKLDSNKLDSLGELLGVGRKEQTGGFELWRGCMEGNKKAWKKMADYNKQDVILLENVYLALRPWITNHPDTNLLSGTSNRCKNCNSDKLQSRGFSILKSTDEYIRRKRRFQCTDCGTWGLTESEKVLRD